MKRFAGLLLAGLMTAGLAAQRPKPMAMAGHGDGHVIMTALAAPQAGDAARAAEIVKEARAAIAPYKDIQVALAAGYREFAPALPNREKHFVNQEYARDAQFEFNPDYPPALLYDHTANGGWKLAGAMYIAPRQMTMAQLNTRVPLSVAHWHRHINYCLPRDGRHLQPAAAAKEFLRLYAIGQPDACTQAGGRWVPEIFGWMVHVYPFDASPWHMAAAMGKP